MKIPIKDIQIGQRQRLEIGDLSDLDSMADKDVGLIQPIIIHKLLSGYELVAGRRRLAKAVSLGWNEIEAFERDTMTEVQKNKAELFEDIARKDRSWQDRVLSISKIHYLSQREQRDGESWTTKHTAIATGFGQTLVKYFLTLAAHLSKTPKDEELWACSTYKDAMSLLVSRDEQQAREELERRRQLLHAEEVPSIIEETPMWDDLEFAPKSQGQLVTPTDSSTKVYIRGYNISFEDAKEGEHYLADHACAVLGYNASTGLIPKIQEALRPDGFGVLWSDEQPYHLTQLIKSVMPFSLIWNKLIFPEDDIVWPFVENIAYGLVIAKDIPTMKRPNPSSCVVSAGPLEPNELPHQVVAYTLKAFCPPNVAVICINNAPVIPILECGNIPVFFEPDEALFDTKVNAMKQWYEENVPGCEVIMP